MTSNVQWLGTRRNFIEPSALFTVSIAVYPVVGLRRRKIERPAVRMH